MKKPWIAVTTGVFAAVVSVAGLKAQDEEERRGPLLEKETLLSMIRSVMKESAARPSVLNEIDSAHARPSERKIARALRRTRLNVSFHKKSLEEILDYLRKVTELNFVVSAKARKLLSEKRPVLTLQLKNLRLSDILDLIVTEAGEFRFTVRSGSLVLVTKREYRPRKVLRIYDVRDIVTPLPDFPAPSLGASLKAPDEEQ